MVMRHVVEVLLVSEEADHGWVKTIAGNRRKDELSLPSVDINDAPGLSADLARRFTGFKRDLRTLIVSFI